MAEINNNDELLLARTIVLDMKFNNQLAQNQKFNAINSPVKEKDFFCHLIQAIRSQLLQQLMTQLCPRILELAVFFLQRIQVS